MRLYSSKDAMEYLSISERQFSYYILSGKIVPDLKDNRKNYFYQSTLEDAKRRLQNEEDYTLKEVYEIIVVQNKNGEYIDGKGQRYSKLDMVPQNLIYHFTQKRNIKPTGKRGGAKTFSISQIKMVVKSEGWMLKSDIHDLRLLRETEEHQSCADQSAQSQENDL